MVSGLRKALFVLNLLLAAPCWAGFEDDAIYPTNTTANRLICVDAENKIISCDLANWIAGTANKVTVTDDGDGSVTITIELTGFDSDDLSQGTVNLYATDANIDAWLTGKGDFTGDLLDSTSTKIATIVDGLITAVVFQVDQLTDAGLYKTHIHTSGLGAVRY